MWVFGFSQTFCNSNPSNMLVVVRGLYVKSWKIKNNRKKPFHIDSDASTNQVFALLDAGHSVNEDEIDGLMNDFDTKFIAPEETKLTIQSMQVLWG